MADLKAEIDLKESQARNLKDVIAIRDAVCSIKNMALDPALERLRVSLKAVKAGDEVSDAMMTSALGVADIAVVAAAQSAWKEGAAVSTLLAEKIQQLSGVIL